MYKESKEGKDKPYRHLTFTSTTSSGQQLSKQSKFNKSKQSKSKESKLKQSNSRRSSKNRHDSSLIRRTTRKEKVLSLDPSFADFDFMTHEKEVMRHLDAKNYNFKQIVASNRNPPSPNPNPYKRFPNSAPKVRATTAIAMNMNPVESSTLKILKAAPIIDENNNFEYHEPSLDEILLNTNDNITSLSPPPPPPPPLLPQPKSSRFFSSRRVKNNTDRSDLSDDYQTSGAEGDEDVYFWLDEFTKAYKREIALVDKSNDLDELSKQKEHNQLLMWWVEDLYQQNGIFSDSFDEIQQSVQKDTEEFQDELLYLQQKLQECHSERSHWKSKAEGLEYENKRNNQIVQKQNEDIMDFKVTSSHIEKDLEALKLLIFRLRDGGVWDMDGLNMSPETFMKIFGGNKDLLGSRLQTVDGKSENQLEDTQQLKATIGKMKHELENLRSKIFNKERKIIKLTSEEQSIKSRIEFFKSQEISLRNRVADLECEENLFREGRFDTNEYDDFVKL